MRIPSIRILSVSILLLACLSAAAAAAPKAPLKAWTDPAAALREDPDFAIQGEYAEATAGAQVVALGDGRFDAYLLEGGLPGAGWAPGKARTVLGGGRQGDEVTLKDDAGTTTATIRKDRMVVVGVDGAKTELSRTERRSPTLGAKPPAGAVVLFDGSSAEAWENGKAEHEGLELAKDFTTSAPITKPLDGPEGPVFLQDHRNPVVFRNVWIVRGR